MVYVWSILLILLNAVWLALVVFGLPGNWLIVISTYLFAWWRRGDGVCSWCCHLVYRGCGCLLAVAADTIIADRL